jgi:hypothetical protein
VTDLDKAGTPAKDYSYRAYNAHTRDAIMLEDPSLIDYYQNQAYVLQKRDNNGNWVPAAASP